jgi:hypothetical protein
MFLLNFLGNKLTDGSEAVSLMRWALYATQGRFLVLVSLRGVSQPQGHSVAIRIRSVEKFQ